MLKLIKTFFQFIYFIYVISWFVILIIASFIVTLFLLLLPNRIKDKGMYYNMKIISNLWFILCGIITKNYNREKIDFSKSYIITPNHQSFIDAAIIYTVVPTLFKSLGKKEIEKAPIYGIIYKIVVITVDRSSMMARAASFRKMKKELEIGVSIVLFSEGTFSNTIQTELLPFQIGGYSLAILQKVDVLPVLFLDAAKRHHPSKVWKFSPGLNRAVYLPPLSTHAIDKTHANHLKDYAQLYMQACLDFGRKNNPEDVWEFAVNWLNENKI